MFLSHQLAQSRLHRPRGCDRTGTLEGEGRGGKGRGGSRGETVGVVFELSKCLNSKDTGEVNQQRLIVKPS